MVDAGTTRLQCAIYALSMVVVQGTNVALLTRTVSKFLNEN